MSTFVCNQCSGKTNVCHGTSSGCKNGNLFWKTSTDQSPTKTVRVNVNLSRRKKKRKKKKIPGNKLINTKSKIEFIEKKKKC